MMMATVSGMIAGLNAGVATSSPSMADSTEIAGVITLSPKNKATPINPRVTTSCLLRGWFPTACRASASRAMLPPSPWLSARMMKPMYFTDTTRISDHTVSESTPRMLSGVGGTPCAPNASCKAYSGLVAMSPKTMPIAASASAGNACVCVAGASARSVADATMPILSVSVEQQVQFEHVDAWLAEHAEGATFGRLLHKLAYIGLAQRTHSRNAGELILRRRR